MVRSFIIGLLTLGACLLAFPSCEVIREEDRLIAVPLPETGQRRHVLIEFTGFRCVNCPAAAENAEALHTLYGDNLILVSMHPASNPFTQGIYDYTCPEADSLYLLMGGAETTPFPRGNIDFMEGADGYLLDPTDWAAQLNTLMKDTVAPYLNAQVVMDTLTRQITVKAGYTQKDDIRLSVWLIENFEGVQAMPDGTVNVHYNHRHVLRAISDKTTFAFPEKCNPAECAVVVILSDKNNNHILNAYETVLDFSTDY